MSTYCEYVELGTRQLAGMSLTPWRAVLCNVCVAVAALEANNVYISAKTRTENEK